MMEREREREGERREREIRWAIDLRYEVDPIVPLISVRSTVRCTYSVIGPI